MNQTTLQSTYVFEGKGLHSGKQARLALYPAAPDTGIVFFRTDIGPKAKVRALAENVSDTSRSTTLSENGVSVATVEHLLSALTGLGVDNAIAAINAPELPILDGSARFYAEAISKDGLMEQEVPRLPITISRTIEISDPASEAWIRIEPAESASFEATIDFNSRVLGVQRVNWTPSDEYVSQIAPCRTFVFLHELEQLYKLGLVRGGDVDNAIVIAERPLGEEQVKSLGSLFGREDIAVNGSGYLNNLELHFADECGRHKLLDLIGDLRLTGGFLQARVSAFKPGHSINTLAAKAIRQQINSI